jgi:hydrogenase nickel incorporation protein HypA/HybF
LSSIVDAAAIRCCAAVSGGRDRSLQATIAREGQTTMHELALSQSIVDLVTQCAAREGVRRVTRVLLDVGAAAAVEPQALQFCFSAVTEQTVAAGAELVINQVPLRARCRDCTREYSPATLFATCPACGSYQRNLLAGRELRVRSFDAE